MPAGPPEPRLKAILRAVRTNLRPREDSPGRRGLSPGLLLMAVVALAISIAAAVKNMK